MPDLIKKPFAQNGDKTAPTDTSTDGAINYDQGYTPFYELDLGQGDPDAKAVERRQMNYLFWLLSDHAKQIQDNGLPLWQPAMTNGYGLNSMVVRESPAKGFAPYRSLVANNTTDPLTSPANWEQTPTGAETKALIPMPWGGLPVTSDSLMDQSGLISTGTDFNTLTNGTWFVKDAATAAVCPNIPADSKVAGMLEARAANWMNGANVTVPIAVQRWLASTGETWTRSFNGTLWTTWTVNVRPADVQSGKYNTIGAAYNSSTLLVTASPVPVLTGIVEGLVLTLKFNSSAAINANAKLSVSGLTAYNILNANLKPLRGGEIEGGSYFRVLQRSDGAWILIGTWGANYAAIKNLELDIGRLPVGAPIQWLSTVIPTGFIKLNGASFSTVNFPELATVYPTGILPDARGVFWRGLDEGRGLDAGRALGTYQESANLSHVHTGTVDSGGLHVHSTTTDQQGYHAHSGTTDQQGNHTHGGVTSADGAHNHTAPVEKGNGPNGPQVMPGSAWPGSRQNNNTAAGTSTDGTHQHNLYINAAGVHAHNLNVIANGLHSHNVTVNQGGLHSHTFTSNQAGGTESRPRNLSCIYIARAY